jgi:predicted DNA-binding ribbon-helix-helix protein
MKSPVVKRSVAKHHSVTIAGHKTCVNLEEPFWNGLQQIAKGRGETASDLIRSIDAEREESNLSSAIRLFVLSDYQHRAGKRTRPSAS